MRNRPPFILAFAADMQGCGWHRIQVPVGALVTSHLADGRIDMTVWNEPQFRAASPDTIVFQRYIEPPQYEMMKAARAGCPDAFLVFELDDFLAGVPEDSYHFGFMPPGLEERVRGGMALCDAVSTTTEQMAEWLRELGAKDVRVIPNLVPMGRLYDREVVPGRKLRVGFAGGISHGGDLKLIQQAMENIGREVEWVFMGMQPEKVGVPVEFHQPVPTHQYLDVLARLDVDLMLAPLQDNRFNRCKSNLRLLESACAGAAVLAQDIDPYLTDSPPVVAYADSPQSWEDGIRQFMAMTAEQQKRSARALRAWVARHYTLEARMADRMKAWLPRTADTWRPARAGTSHEKVIVSSPNGADTVALPASLKRAPFVVGLEAACVEARIKGADVLWLRPGTQMESLAWDRIKVGASGRQDVGGVVPIATDGPNSFPKLAAFTPMSPDKSKDINAIFAQRAANMKVNTPMLMGPCILLHREALAMFGVPDVAGCFGSEEAAILEWGLRLLGRQRKHVQVADAYVGTFTPPLYDSERMTQRLHARGYEQQMRLGVENLPDDLRRDAETQLLRNHWTGLQPGLGGLANDYETWSALHTALFPITPGRTEITVRDYEDPILHSDAEWTVLVDERTTLKPHAVAALSAALDGVGSETLAVYGDHEIRQGTQVAPCFKPDFDMELFLARDYVTPVVAVRTVLLRQHQADPVRNSTDIYALLLRLVAGMRLVSHGSRQKTIRHVPHVLATVNDTGSTESKASDVLQRQAAIEAVFGDAVQVEPFREIIGCLHVRRQWGDIPDRGAPVSIIVATRGDGWVVQPCLQTILRLTKYPSYEIIVVMTGEGEPDLGLAVNDPRVKVTYWREEFNWAKLHNDVVSSGIAGGDLLCFMNDDVRAAVPEWLDRMVAQAVQPDVAAVGARLLFPQGAVQHIGVVCHNGVNGHLHKGLQPGQAGYWGIAVLPHEAAAVTGACMLVERSKFLDIGGFDQSLAYNYNDTAFCLEARALGYRNVVETHAELQHIEGATRPTLDTARGMELLKQDTMAMTSRYQTPDPYWNPNFALIGLSGGMFVQGLNYEAYSWTERKIAPDAQRVLVVNDTGALKGIAAELTIAGAVVFVADLSDFALQMVSPAPANLPGWDVRRPEELKHVLNGLGIDRIHLCSLIGTKAPAAPVESLRGLIAIGLPIDAGDILGEMTASADLFGRYDKDAVEKSWRMAAGEYDQEDGKRAAD